MNTKFIIRDIMLRTDVTNAKLANRLSITAQTMYDRIFHHTDKDLNVAIALDILKAMDYKLVVMPANKSISDDSYEVTK